jgi:hypothetical protein
MADQRVKLDPLAYILTGSVLALQVYSSFIKAPNADAVIVESDRAYQSAVFEDGENKGVMHQIFRQNEVDRELLKVLLRSCSR